MNEQTACTDKPRKWYNDYKFILPFFKYKKGDEYNTPGFTFEWLFFRFWTLDAPAIEVSFIISSHWGLGFVGTLLYLRWAICIPCPYFIDKLAYKYLWRKPNKPNIY